MGQGININVQDNGLGAAIPGGGGVLVVAGVSSTGTANVPTESTNPATFTTTYGYGPGPQLAAQVAENTGNPVIFVKVATGSSGTNTSVHANVGGGSTSTVTLTGTPNDTYYGLVTVLTGGTITSNGIVLGISLDAGRTTFQTVLLGTATTYVIPTTGITLNFGGGSLVAGDTFSWVSTEPTWTDANVQSALNSLLSVALPFQDIMIPGGSAAINGAGTVGVTSGDVSAIDGYMTTLFNNRRYARCLLQARDAMWGGNSTETEVSWMSSLESAFVNASSLRVGVCAGHYNWISAVDQCQYRRSLLWGAAVRDAAVAIQVDLGRVSDGALTEMVLPSAPDGYIYHDESVNQGLDATRFTSVWSIISLPGLYIKNPYLMAPPGSDFSLLQHGHVIDAVSLAAYQFFVKRLSSAVRVNATTGFILQQDANTLQQGATAAINAALGNAISAVAVIVSTTDNILSTSTLTVTIQVTPLAYLKTINITIQFINPALQPVQTAGLT
jgi:hypothetical protein